MPDNSPRPFDTSVSRWFFGVCILFVLYLAYRLVEPFLLPIFLAVVVVVVAEPLYVHLLQLSGGRRALASGLTCLLLGLIIVLPFFLVAGIITAQALDLYNTVSQLLKDNKLEQLFNHSLGQLTPYLERARELFGLEQGQIFQQVGELVRKVSNLLYANLTGLVKGVTNALIGFAEVLFVAFYLFMDGPLMADKALSLFPLPREMSERIRLDILVSLRATLKGTVVLALIQGLAGGLGFWIFGVPNAPFWGTVMVFSSVVPLVGTALVWVPAGLYLMAMDQTGQALGAMGWCLAAGLTCDNILRPRLLGAQGGIHPLLTFFSVLGGISLFGVVGLLLGPLVLAVLLSLLEVYQRYFQNGFTYPADALEQTSGDPPSGPAKGANP
jgi:predicted PurR-regulated permease PerM